MTVKVLWNILWKIYGTYIRENASFMEQLGSTSSCKCVKCAPMPSGIECQCCKEMEGVVERVADNESHVSMYHGPRTI